ncbi:NAD(P)-dependent oxidoreductase [Dyadobacter psychrotolerans]|uniref:NAD-dependent epimerase/dehydratase family protein n=1 Tax=Dyadobacter psychrotolerans TaxID=2541721 RepID=A0A4R5DWP7_9BACT|nr:NAD(P)H-binding protein [Dyadobacter psychrotolerans]TDE16840.1 NAD-dependent epimerase/dehydratase family protein [Dyadobacter psychrotolerans]
MEKNHKMAVIGGGGRTGKYVVKQLLEKGYHLKLLLRNPETNTISENPNFEIVQGDVLDYDAVRMLLADCAAVISTEGQRKDEPLVASRATSNILDAVEKSNYPFTRYISVAGLNVDTPLDKKGSETIAATEWMKSNFPLIHEDRQKSFQILAESNADWTLVRVPFIEFTEDRKEMAVSLQDSPGKKIYAADIAGFLIGQLDDDQYIRKAPFIANI